MNQSTSTTNEPRQALARLLENFGPDVLNDPRRVEGLLRDYCPGRRRDVSALVAAQKERVVTELTTLREQMPLAVLTARLARRLHEEVGLTEELSRWAVATWAAALGMAVDEEDYQVPASSFAGHHLAADTDIHKSAVTLTERDDRSMAEQRRRETLDRIGSILRQSQEHAESDQSLHLAEQARELALAAQREWAEDGDVHAAVDSATAWLTQAAARGAREAQAAGNLGLAAVCLRRLLELQPRDSEAQKRRERILAKRRELDKQSESLWNDGKLDKAVRLLEQMHRAFPDDAQLAERLDQRRTVSARALSAVKQEIPELRAKKCYAAIRRLLGELESVAAPVKGLSEFAANVEKQFALVEPSADEAQAAFNRGEYGTAFEYCLRVLAVVADHDQAILIRDEIAIRLDSDQRLAADVERAIDTGTWRTAGRMLHAREQASPLPPSLMTLRRRIDERLAALIAYWRLLGAAILGAGLWLAAGILAKRTAPSLITLLPPAITGHGYFSFLAAAIVPHLQLLLAAFLLGFGGTLIYGRSSLMSIGWNCLTTMGCLIVIGVVDVGLDAANFLQSHRSIVPMLIYGLFAGWLIGVWLRCGCGIRRTEVLRLGLGGAAATGCLVGYEAFTSNAHLLFCGLTAISYGAAATLVGLVQEVRRLALLPIGVLLAYGLTGSLTAATLSPPVVAIIVGIVLAGTVLALAGQGATWKTAAAAVVLGVVTALAVHAAVELATAPATALLLTIWAAVLFVRAIGSTPRPDGRLFLIGLQTVFVDRSGAHVPTTADNSSTQ